MTHGESGKPPFDLVVHFMNTYNLAVNKHAETTITPIIGKVDCLMLSTTPKASGIFWKLLAA